jgi:hypothetical protein
MGFDTGGVKNSKLFEELATSSWNLAAGVQTPERGTGASHTNPSTLNLLTISFG